MSAKIEAALSILIYFLFRVVAFPLIVFYFLYRGLRNREYFRSWGERFGGAPAPWKRTAPGSVWFHAVSVGEVISCIRVIEEIRSRNAALPIYLSIGTVAGKAIAQQRLDRVVNCIFYAPIDYPFAIRRVLRRIRPAVLVILETEIWPALYREAKRARCGLIILNGRISDRAFPKYQRWRRIFKLTLSYPDAIYVQSEVDRERYISLGARKDRVHVSGNLKYDARPPAAGPPAVVEEIIGELRPEAVVIAASTMSGVDSSDVDEDDLVLDAFRHLSTNFPRLLLLLAPRKPERFDVVARKILDANIRFVRRSGSGPPAGVELPLVLLLDSIGELAATFPVADVVFVGGTVAKRGGHNILEPAACGRAIVVGPHLENFSAIASEFRAQKAILEVQRPGDLVEAIGTVLRDSALRHGLGRRALQVARKHGGAASNAATAILDAQDSALPVWIQPGPSKPLLWILSRLWAWGSQWDRRRKVARQRHLYSPVISVGGISMGGTGKTPLVESLAEHFSDKGLRPAILTRGYKRRSVADQIVVPAGSVVAAWKTGDEPQIFVRRGDAHVGIGPDRWAVGRTLEEQLSPDLFLLDDGFQHRSLHRNLDIVLLDALNPFHGGEVFPLGNLREPVSALERADVIVLAHAQPHREYAGAKSAIRAVNVNAPIFFSRVVPKHWVNERTREHVQCPPRPCVAFCGLASPATFWITLQELGIQPLFRWEFDDHHYYTQRELKKLARQAQSRGAGALLTTEKDAMNLPERALEMLSPVELYWLKIGIRISNERDFLALVDAKLRR